MRRRLLRSTRADTLFPYTTLLRSRLRHRHGDVRGRGGIRAGGADHDLGDGLLACDADHRHARERGEGLRVSDQQRSEEHTSELQSIMRNSYAVFCMKKKNLTSHSPSNITPLSSSYCTYLLHL